MDSRLLAVSRAVVGVVLLVLAAGAAADTLVVGGSDPAEVVTVAAGLETDITVTSDPTDLVTDVCWVDDRTVVVGTGKGLVRFDTSSNRRSVVVPGLPLPEGVLGPSSVACDGAVLLAYSQSRLALSAWRAGDGKRIFAYRRPPGFHVQDVAVWRGRMVILGFPREGNDPTDNPTGAAVWVGPLEPDRKALWPLHVLHSKTAERLFPFTMWPLAGGLAVEPDGTLDVISVVEPGVYRYGPDARSRGVLGRGLQELVGRRLREACGERYAEAPEDRYREIVNRQPWVSDLVASPNGPAILVRRFADGVERWELWYPDAKGVRAVVRLPYEIHEVAGRMRAEMRGDRLAAVVARRSAGKEKTGWEYHLLIFRVPRLSHGRSS